MPEKKPNRRPDPDPGFEVVEDEAPDFEVVDDEPPKPARPPAKAAKPAPRKPLKAEVEEEEPEEEEEERPRPKKKKKKKSKFRKRTTAADTEEDDHDRALREYEWIVPGVLLGLGVIMCFVGAFGAAGKAAAFHTIGVMVIGLIITVPITIGALMIVGMLVGIEYGRLGPAILKIAAITFVVNGIYFIGDWLKLPGFVVFPLGCFISFGLFMSQFELDVWETNASVGAINVLTFIANVVMIGFLIVAEDKLDKKRDRGAEPDDDVPADTRPADTPKGKWKGNDQRRQQPPPDDPDDGDPE